MLLPLYITLIEVLNYLVYRKARIVLFCRRRESLHLTEIILTDMNFFRGQNMIFLVVLLSVYRPFCKLVSTARVHSGNQPGPLYPRASTLPGLGSTGAQPTKASGLTQPKKLA